MAHPERQHPDKNQIQTDKNGNVDSFDKTVSARPAICAYFSERDNTPGVYHQNGKKVIDVSYKIGVAGSYYRMNMPHFGRAAYVDKIRYRPRKWQHKQQKNQRNGNYRCKGIIVHPLLVVFILIQIPEKRGFHPKCHYSIQYRNISKHG